MINKGIVNCSENKDTQIMLTENKYSILIH